MVVMVTHMCKVFGLILIFGLIYSQMHACMACCDVALVWVLSSPLFQDHRILEFLGNLCVCGDRPIPSNQSEHSKMLYTHGAIGGTGYSYW